MFIPFHLNLNLGPRLYRCESVVKWRFLKIINKIDILDGKFRFLPFLYYIENSNSAVGGRQSSLAAHTALKNRNNDKNTLTKSSKSPLRPAGASPAEDPD